MKNMKRWMAFLLVAVMIAGAGIRQLNTTMSANETGVSEQSAQEAEGQAEAKVQAEADAKAQAEAEAEAKVQAEAEAAAQAQVEADAKAQAEAEAAAQAQAEVQTSETEAQTEPQTSEAAVVEEAEITYDVSIKEPEENGGAVKVWTTGEKRDVSFSDGLYKEVLKEGETLHIEITANGDYEVKKVTDENGASIRQTSVNEKVYNYEIANVTSNKTVNITYNKVETAKEEKEETGGKKDDSKKDDSAEESDEGEADSKEEVKEPEEAPSEKVKNEAEAEKPAQTLTTTAEGGVQIKVTAPEGALPEGATVKAVKADSAAVKNAVEEAVSEEGKELVSYVAYDITITDKDGNEIQPDENVRVSISGTLVGGAEKEVYHVADGNAEKVAGAMAMGNVAVFTAEHFSIYSIVGGNNQTNNLEKGSAERLPMIIFNANGGAGEDVTYNYNNHADQIRLREDGDYGVTLPEPATIGITNGDKTFVGWSVQPDGVGSNYIAGIEYVVKPKETINFYAIWLDENSQGEGTEVYFFVRQEGGIRYEPADYSDSEYYPKDGQKYSTMKGKLKQPIAINNNTEVVKKNIAEQPTDKTIKDCLVSYGVSYDPATQYIQWYAVKFIPENNKWHVDGVISSRQTYSVTYDTNGGSTDCPAAKRYRENEPVTVSFSPTPSRAGYKFLGWAKNKAATTPDYVQSGTHNRFDMPARDVVLYAVWKANENTLYTVEHYLESQNGYTLEEAEEKVATLGTEVSAIPKQYSGYTCDTKINGTVESGIVTADETLVLKLYYKADPAEIVFRENGGSEVNDLKGYTAWAITNREMPTTTRAGYVFDGWYADDQFTGDKVDQLPGEFPPGTTTYYAKWSPDEIPTPAPSLLVEKVAAQKDGGYEAGDVVTYTITVTNNGNVTVSDIEVVDELTGETLKVNEPLAPGEQADPIEVEYTVTEADVLNGSVVNVATATGKDPDGNNVSGEGEEEVTTVPVSRSLNVEKTVTNAPANGTAYQTGESILYEVVVTNTGNVTLYNINVTDQMQGAAGNAELRAGESATIDELAPGASAEPLHYTYTVRAADAGATLRNGVVAVDNTDTQDDDITPGEPVVTTPTVTPGGNPTVTPGGNPAGPATPAAIIPAAAPVVDTVEGFLRELTESEDDEVPLANNNLEHEHKCCIFHFLVLLISLILLAFFTRSMKKRQEKIFELREELDTELAKRGLPLSNENK